MQAVPAAPAEHWVGFRGTAAHGGREEWGLLLPRAPERGPMVWRKETLQLVSKVRVVCPAPGQPGTPMIGPGLPILLPTKNSVTNGGPPSIPVPSVEGPVQTFLTKDITLPPPGPCDGVEEGQKAAR